VTQLFARRAFTSLNKVPSVAVEQVLPPPPGVGVGVGLGVESDLLQETSTSIVNASTENIYLACFMMQLSMIMMKPALWLGDQLYF